MSHPVARPVAAAAAPARGAVIVAFAIVYVVWGSTYLAMRIAVHTLPPFLLAGTRFLVAGLILYLWSRRGRDRVRLTAKHWREAAISGCLLLVGGNGAVVWAVQVVPSGVAALMIATVPVWTVLLQWLLEGTRPRLVTLVGLAAGIAGVAVLIGPALTAAAAHAAAIPRSAGIVLLLAALSWAIGSLRARRAPPLPGTPFLLTGMQMIIGGAVLLLLGIATHEPARLHATTVTGASVAALAYLVLFGSLIGYSAFGWLLQNAPPARVATYAYVNPVIAVLLGWALGHEPLTARVLVAAAVILGAVALITSGSARRTSA